MNTRTGVKYKAVEMKGEAKLIISKVEKTDAGKFNNGFQKYVNLGRYKLELELTKRDTKPTTEANLTVRVS